MGEAALDIALSGWPVFPCEHRLDPPGQKRNKRPLTAHGFSDATTSPKQIALWWKRFPDAMIGIPAGKASGVWVLDVDIDKDAGLDGEADLRNLESSHEELPLTAEVVTPRGGRHKLFRWQEGITNSQGGLPPSINVRGDGGYFIAPPSRREDGKIYCSVVDVPPVDAPEWLLSIIKKPEPRPVPPRANGRTPIHSYVDAALRYECDAVGSQGKGGRNRRLNQAAFSLGQIVGAGALDESTVVYSLMAAAARCGVLAEDGEKQTRTTIASGLRAGKTEPRRLPEAPVPDPKAAESQRALADRKPAEPIEESGAEEETRPSALDTSQLEDFRFEGDVYAPQSMPGLLGAVAAHILETALFPVPDFACLSALVFASALYGRRWTEPIMGGGLNIYAIATAPTGWGKDHPLHEPRNLAYRSGLMHLMGPGEFKSDSAIEKTLRKCPIRACFMDEIGIVLQANASRQASSWERRVRKALLEVYSASKSMWTGSQAAGDKDERDKGSEPLHRPCLSIYGTSTPEELYKGLTDDNIRDGLFGRLIFAAPDNRPKRQKPGSGLHEDIGTLIEQIRDFSPPEIPEKQRALYHANLRNATLPPVLIRVQADAQASGILETIQEWQRDLTERETSLASIANRAAENVGKIASIRALSRDHEHPLVVIEDAKWGWSIVERSLFVIARDIEQHMVGSEFEGLVKAILHHIRGAGRDGLKFADLRQRRGVGKAHARDIESALRMLEQGEEIVRDRSNRGSRVRIA